MGRKRIDVLGRRFGKLTATGYMGCGRWQCACDCGGSTIRRGVDLQVTERNGWTAGCAGCSPSSRHSAKHEVNGKQMSVRDLEKDYRISRYVIYGRLRNGWDINEAVKKKLGERR